MNAAHCLFRKQCGENSYHFALRTLEVTNSPSHSSVITTVFKIHQGSCSITVVSSKFPVSNVSKSRSRYLGVLRLTILVGYQNFRIHAIIFQAPHQMTHPWLNAAVSRKWRRERRVRTVICPLLSNHWQVLSNEKPIRSMQYGFLIDDVHRLCQIYEWQKRNRKSGEPRCPVFGNY